MNMCMFGVYFDIISHIILFCVIQLISATGNEAVETTTSQQTQGIHWSSHCKNGGTGFFGSFCHCPPDFEGRFCEIKREPHAGCGYIQHGRWVKDDCMTCYCLNAVISCTDNSPQKCSTHYDMGLDKVLNMQIEKITKGEASSSSSNTTATLLHLLIPSILILLVVL
ncbi:uncharacterized protein LOC117115397 [Anneissia japonica]|uniref:uncharacterized protein LOC117115397 n=1 Tax=Anneissia japonica TaxID=1529436 RepID=UPI001425B63F|nr:uncharacterized protein LOC117115397 [Anneissia japonica]